MSPNLRRASVLAAVVALAGVSACARRPAAAPVVSGAEVIVDRSPGPMQLPIATRLGDDLKAIGLDPKDLPPLETLDAKTKRRLMTSFSESLGVPCNGCHAEGDFSVDTRRKRVAKRMYNELVRVLATTSGEAVFCDSCHQGAMFFLDRRDKAKVADFMIDGMVGKLKRVDGTDHDCATCHGDNPDFAFIARWKGAPAPDIDTHPPARRVEHATPVVPVPPPAPAAAAAARKKSAPPRQACGDKNNLCPLQVWMRTNISPAVVANDAGALAKALDRVAALSPDPSWDWSEISRRGAEAARRGDIDEARKSCRECHDAYKALWREKYRSKAVR